MHRGHQVQASLRAEDARSSFKTRAHGPQPLLRPAVDQFELIHLRHCLFHSYLLVFRITNSYVDGVLYLRRTWRCISGLLPWRERPGRRLTCLLGGRGSQGQPSTLDPRDFRERDWYCTMYRVDAFSRWQSCMFLYIHSSIACIIIVHILVRLGSFHSISDR